MSANSTDSCAVESVKPYGDSDPRAKGSQVEAMFDSIAPAYDVMNKMMSLGIDRRWRRLTSDTVARHVAGISHPHILDVATGTADLLLRMARDIPPAKFTGADLSAEMMAIGSAKLHREGIDASRFEMVRADSMALPFGDSTFDAVTVAFGVRNFADIARGLSELRRVLKPGGLLCVLELSTPRSPLVLPFYRLYTQGVIPVVGRMLSHDKNAYSYLPASIAAVPQGTVMLEMMNRAGMRNPQAKTLTLGVCTLYTSYC